MPPLRSQRRNRKSKAPKRRKRRNLVKFIPSADGDFALTARNFSVYLDRYHSECGVTAGQAAEVKRVVEEYRGALARSANRRTQTRQTTGLKNEARKNAEDVVRRLANIIRADPLVNPHHKAMLRIKERPKRLKPRACPQRPPVLRFVGSGDGVLPRSGTGGGSGVHVLEYLDMVDRLKPEMGIKRRAKPDGAVRLELFVDLVPVGEPVPKSPLDTVRAGRGWPWYLRSFTRSPIEVEYPLAQQPMLVCYWGRWADSTGETGRFSETCVARIEGWTPSAPERALHAGGQVALALPSGFQSALPEGQSASHLIEAKCIIVQLPYAEELAGGEQESMEHVQQRLLVDQVGKNATLT